MPVFLGLFLCSKQYLIWAAPTDCAACGVADRFSKAHAYDCDRGHLWVRRESAADIVGFEGVSVCQCVGRAGCDRGAAIQLSYIALLTNTTGWHVSTSTVTIIGCGLATLATILVCLVRRSVAGYAAAVGTCILFSSRSTSLRFVIMTGF